MVRQIPTLPLLASDVRGLDGGRGRCPEVNLSVVRREMMKMGRYYAPPPHKIERGGVGPPVIFIEIFGTLYTSDLEQGRRDAGVGE